MRRDRSRAQLLALLILGACSLLSLDLPPVRAAMAGLFGSDPGAQQIEAAPRIADEAPCSEPARTPFEVRVPLRNLALGDVPEEVQELVRSPRPRVRVLIDARRWTETLQTKASVSG